MRVTVNDQDLEIPEPCSVSELLARLALPGTRVAVEVNRQIVRRVDHAGRTLAAGDRIEVVTLVGGG
ncbi:MAG: sulfur carrier protein ThiS [Planctomycetes bacterium]|nr:sulfur carrier protein ThiS [Planctomycetota bacterium]